MKQYDVIVIGAGHAGCEAANAAAKLGAEVLLVSVNLDHIAQMSCNPAIGGIAKGQVVREIDALGGLQGIVTDHASIQFRLLNRAKGPAVWSPRSQCDKLCYQRAMKFALERIANIDIFQAEITGFELKNRMITGVTTSLGETIHGKSFILTAGTSLAGRLHYGMQHFSGGRSTDIAAERLAVALKEQLQLEIGRLKTGTPPRVLAKTIDFSAMQPQPPDDTDESFSHWWRGVPDYLPYAERRNMFCYGVYSTEETNRIVQANLHQAPMYQGKIEGIGTRYCPSFEDKVVRFAHHPRHLLYLEPEGEFTDEYYLNGISTSLPPDVQRAMLHSIPGLEKAVISRYAYAIEYDFVFPHQITRGLALKEFPNFFTAGQVNGTSGYEEAAGQGLVAGINAARYAAGKSAVEFQRDQSYIGVMIDDLVTKEIIEPYRLFTSRAEYRLHLRNDNADIRLTPLARKLGLLSQEETTSFDSYLLGLAQTRSLAKGRKIKGKTLFELLRAYGGTFDETIPLPFPEQKLFISTFPDRVKKQILKELAIEAHYDGYLQREEVTIRRLKELEEWRIPDDFDYDAVKGLSNESRLKLEKIRPTTLAQAGRIDGVKPPELALLQVILVKKRKQDKNDENGQ